ncbi:MAG TPA: hypothetical protein VMW52_10125 [Phycisphaerae bacterium]|nr:hypothetical protein [Phycisphaerae bacterium]
MAENVSATDDARDDPPLAAWEAWLFWGAICVATLGWGLVYIGLWHAARGLALVIDRAVVGLYRGRIRRSCRKDAESET